MGPTDIGNPKSVFAFTNCETCVGSVRACMQCSEGRGGGGRTVAAINLGLSWPQELTGSSLPPATFLKKSDLIARRNLFHLLYMVSSGDFTRDSLTL